MARIAANGAVISDDGQWYYTGLRWKPLVDGAAAKPKLASNDDRQAGKLAMKGASLGRLGQQLAELVTRFGSLDAAEESLGQVVRAKAEACPAQTIKTYTSVKDFQRDAEGMLAQGWRVAAQSVQQGHVNAGRTAVRIATGGVLLGGVSRSKDQILVTYER